MAICAIDDLAVAFSHVSVMVTSPCRPGSLARGGYSLFFSGSVQRQDIQQYCKGPPGPQKPMSVYSPVMPLSRS